MRKYFLIALACLGFGLANADEVIEGWVVQTQCPKVTTIMTQSLGLVEVRSTVSMNAGSYVRATGRFQIVAGCAAPIVYNAQTLVSAQAPSDSPVKVIHVANTFSDADLASLTKIAKQNGAPVELRLRSLKPKQIITGVKTLYRTQPELADRMVVAIANSSETPGWLVQRAGKSYPSTPDEILRIAKR